MATIYLRSTDGNDADDGSTWALAKATLAAALTAAGAGGTVYVSDNHAENAGAAALTFGSPGTAASPCRVLCVDDSAEPPTALATTATIQNTTGGSSDMTFSGFAYVYGISFNLGVGSSSSVGITFQNTTPLWWKLEKCLLRVATSGASAYVSFGPSASATDNALVEMVDSQFQFAATGQAVGVRTKFIMTAPTGVQPLVLGTIPTTLFVANNDAAGFAQIIGIDWSQLTSGKNLITLASTSCYDWTFRNCKLSTTGTVATGAASGIGSSRVKLVNCASTDTNYELDDNQYGGRITQETTIVRTTPTGATDGTTPTSRKMVSSANAKFEAPLISDPIEFWNETTGSGVTITVAVVTDNVTLTDAEAWVEVEYLGTSGFPLADLSDDRAADILATPANQTTDGTSTWVTTGLATPVKQELSIAVTPQEKGIIRARVMLAKASTTMYFDPLILTGARQFQTSDSYQNQPAAGGGGGGQTIILRR